MAKTLKEVDKQISKAIKAIEKYDKKEEKDGSLSNEDASTRNAYQKMLNEYLAEKESILNGTSKEIIPAKPKNTPPTNAPAVSAPSVNKPTNTNNTLEKSLENVEEKAKETADEMNSEEDKNKKTEDAKSATETAKNIASQIDANVEENIPTWFWREAQEMSPTDKAKRGFIISNYLLNRLGTATGNIGAIIQNAGGSGGATIKEHGGSYIDQYRQSKLEQAMSNRKTKQNTLLQMQGDAAMAYGKSENETRAVQNKLRNSKYWNKYNRLTNEQQVYIQGLLYNDTSGKISDAVLGNLIDQIMKGKDVSLEKLATTALTASEIDNVDKIVSGVTSFTDKVLEWLNWK